MFLIIPVFLPHFFLHFSRCLSLFLFFHAFYLPTFFAPNTYILPPLHFSLLFFISNPNIFYTFTLSCLLSLSLSTPPPPSILFYLPLSPRTLALQTHSLSGFFFLLFFPPPFSHFPPFSSSSLTLIPTFLPCSHFLLPFSFSPIFSSLHLSSLFLLLFFPILCP